MKLSGVFSATNQMEKIKFLNFLDKVCQEAAEKDSKVNEIRANIEKIKKASNNEVIELFNAVREDYKLAIKYELSLLNPQYDLLVNILTRDGNSIVRRVWLQDLYQAEWGKIDRQSQDILTTMSGASDDYNDEAKRFKIYYECFKEAFINDQRQNREAKISDDERGILNVLARQLEITLDDRVAIEHTVSNIPKGNINECLEKLREIGLILISHKNQSVYIPNEIVEILHEVQGKKLEDKYILRILRTFSDAELSNVLKSHNKRIRGVKRSEKIAAILAMGLDIDQILTSDMHNPDLDLNGRKNRLKVLIDDLELNVDKLGATIEERCEIISKNLKKSLSIEASVLSAAGYKEMFDGIRLFWSNTNGHFNSGQ